jgi:hypothetical protein
VIRPRASTTPLPKGGKQTSPQDARVAVLVSNDEKRMNDEALAALAKHPEVYRRGGVLVRALRSEGPTRAIVRPPGSPRIVPIPEAVLREMLAERVNFLKWGRQRLRSVNPPQQCYRALLHRGHWPELRPLEGVTESPLLRPDGSVLQEPGYDEMTGVLYLPNARFPQIPLQPTAQQVETALRDLKAVVCDFPFRKEIDRAAWFASLLTPLARHAFSGPSPCNVIDANTPGAGKGLLASTASWISTGRDIARMPHCQDSEEQRKAILGVAIEAIPTILIDNVEGPFGSAVLDAAFTATEWRDRLLGQSKMVTAPLTAIWYVTGNNLVVVGDTTRRCLRIRLESPWEHPEERADFVHPDLLSWVKRHRGRLTAAALTLLRAFSVAGRPDQGLTPWGSFEGWSDLIRNCIVWLGLPDPAETRIELRSAAGGEDSLVRGFVAGLAEVFQNLPGHRGTARDILQELADSPPAKYPRLRDALSELIPTLDADTHPGTIQLGVFLKRYRGRVVEGKAVEHALGPKTNRGQPWCVRSVEGERESDAGDASDGDTPFAEIGSEAKSTRRGTSSRASLASLVAALDAPPDPELERWEI